MQSVLSDARTLIDDSYTRLLAIDEATGSQPYAPGKWTRKQMLGHLFDSAVNNHQRFVRAQLEGELTFPGYEQNGWVASQQYDERSWSELVTLWRVMNDHLHHVASHVPVEHFDIPCTIGSYATVTLEELIADYYHHMRHHLGQILGDESMVGYP